MARARNIKPSFFQHDVIGEIDPLARLLFIGMWTICDFRGCVEYRPKRIKAQVLPYDEGARIDDLVRQLDESGLIAIYSVLGTAYIKVLNFERHQNPHKNERDAGSEIPDIQHELAQVVDYKGLAKNPDKDGTTRAESLFPLPSSLNLIPEPIVSDGATPPTAQAKTARSKKESAKPKEPAPTSQIWEAYRSAYFDRYRVDPVRNATVNGQMAQLISRLGLDEAPEVAEFYVRSNNNFYASKGHPVGLLLADAEKLRMEWATGRSLDARKNNSVKPMTSFAQSDREAGLLRWEEMTGESHPEMDEIRAQRGQVVMGNVVDVTPQQFRLGA